MDLFLIFLAVTLGVPCAFALLGLLLIVFAALLAMFRGDKK